MPLKLIPPKPGKTPNYYIRGTYLGQYVEESTGTPNKTVASALLRSKREAIERGEVQSRRQLKQEPTFLSAAIAYMSAGGERRFIGEFDEETGEWKEGLLTHLGETLLRDIDQQVIDNAAMALYPKASAATRNRQVYTPVSAILRHAGIELRLRRPKGAQGKQRLDWLQPEQAYHLFKVAEKEDGEFAAFLVFLCYTGCRLSDALNLTCDHVVLSESFAFFEKTKNDEPRSVHLPPIVVTSLANLPKGMERGREKVFRFRKNGYLYNLLKRVKKKAGDDLSFVTFHTFSHTWATWMRRYAGLDTRGLVGTGRWKDLKSAARYEHVVVSEESLKANLLPTAKRKKNKLPR
ncbi:site-specific integrase [Nitratireductor aquimarinus]|uniref:tyrosine-type recombinase/integrase n=1 Tax=Alphaproteobacteria TaxID=28211 RepID=UPI0019D37FC9|nr:MULTISPECIES: site-specific integrase [Alphaproteobacteria]MBN7755440.1 site-specific integrase [Nitratireductor aquimarinus]MBY5998195.1 site-specific integrase [Tritonibacter mobilis]MBY6020222.1 site-specific integrase [Nitratireductor sp. DP7N14-4]